MAPHNPSRASHTIHPGAQAPGGSVAQLRTRQLCAQSPPWPDHRLPSGTGLWGSGEGQNRRKE